jgi:hypothetical protein
VGASTQALTTLERSLRRAFAWLSDNSPITLGGTVLPRELIDGDPDELLLAIQRQLSLLAKTDADQDVGMFVPGPLGCIGHARAVEALH